jgi:hypothetical protein
VMQLNKNENNRRFFVPADNKIKLAELVIKSVTER